MSEFKPLEQSDLYLGQVEHLQLVAPTLQISDVLQNRMLRHGRSLEVDENALLAGVRALEVERPTVICFDSIPKDSDTITPDIALTWPQHNVPAEATIRINPNIDAEKAQKGGYKFLNAAFWTGVLATEALGEGHGAAYESERNKIGKWTKRHYISGVVAGNAVTAPLALATHAGLGGAAAGVGVQLLVYAGIAVKDRVKKTATLSSFVIAKHADKGKQLAEEYPVLSQDYVLG